MNITSQPALAASITKVASKQTYYTIRFLVDRDRVADAYRAYAYFRWVDDTLDNGPYSGGERRDFLQRQKYLLEACYRGEIIRNATIEEKMLVELVEHDHGKNSGLQSYLHNMMQVMDFDTNRRGRIISQSELNEYTRLLATAVTEAMHYFIGSKCFSPRDETRYLAATGAHITHMLRDTFSDVQAGYYNIPREALEEARVHSPDAQSKMLCSWVQSRVQLARTCFKTGREYLAKVEEPRCKLAGFAYIARFEWLLDTIERDSYCLRQEYNQGKNLGTGLQTVLLSLAATMKWRGTEAFPKMLFRSR